MTNYLEEVCRIGQGAACCRFLVLGGEGFTCAKFDQVLVRAIESNHDMIAKSDNCSGKPGVLTGAGLLH